MNLYVEIRDDGKSILGIVTTPKGYVYACRWARDSHVTEMIVRKAWRETRRDFLPYDQSTGTFLHRPNEKHE